jgi:hypothetical protein
MIFALRSPLVSAGRLVADLQCLFVKIVADATLGPVPRRNDVEEIGDFGFGEWMLDDGEGGHHDLAGKFDGDYE